MPVSIVSGALRRRVESLVSEDELSAVELIQRFLDLLGPELDVSRACFNVKRNRVYTTELEWLAAGVKSSLGEKVSARIIESLVADDIRELNKDTAKELLPPGLRLISGSVLGILEVLQRLVAIVAGPIRYRGELVAVVSFDICKERKASAGWSGRKLNAVGALIQRFNSALEREKDLLGEPPFIQ
ncbi:MAG: hypothetical protein GF399_00290 [Candidatus Coatesbacteria bacterium]|nr:hypothetical protein [Candidatus Coatesbacteria bacterium]